MLYLRHLADFISEAFGLVEQFLQLFEQGFYICIQLVEQTFESGA